MLNPKLIEKYGNETREAFTGLAEEIGLDLAKQCYVVDEGFSTSICGVRLPDHMVTTSERVDDIKWAVHTFGEKNYVPGEEFWIMVFKREPKEEDLQLWV